MAGLTCNSFSSGARSSNRVHRRSVSLLTAQVHDCRALFGFFYPHSLCFVKGCISMAADPVIVNQQEILANQRSILDNQTKLSKMLANQATIVANQESILGNQAKLDKVLANQAQLLANQET